MAVPKKGWRTIAVKERTYYWRANGTDWGIDVVIVTDAAFERGKVAQQLRFTLDYDHLETPRPAGGVSLHQRAAVAPGVVRLAIERALTLSPPFKGDHGAPHVTLPPELVAELQSSARLEQAV
jgi:hypothetical protein